jgi:hypothetical protein
MQEEEGQLKHQLTLFFPWRPQGETLLKTVIHLEGPALDFFI